MENVWESPAREDVFGKHFQEASYIIPWHGTGLRKGLEMTPIWETPG